MSIKYVQHSGDQHIKTPRKKYSKTYIQNECKEKRLGQDYFRDNYAN